MHAILLRTVVWGALAAGTGLSRPALAFPLIDPSNLGSSGALSDLAAPDAQDLSHQLQIANGLAGAGSAFGWTFQPRLGLQESLTDNILQAHSPMRWDLTTSVSPGIAIVGNTSRAQVRFDYAPVLIMNARTGTQNALHQQLNGTATVTAIDEFAFIDLRALSGIQSTRGAAGAGAGGTVGASDSGGLTAGSGGGLGGTSLLGTSQQDTVQTVSVGISPYLLKKFGEYGTLRLGYSLNMSQSSPAAGFQFSPFPTGGGSQKQTTTEQTMEFRSGDILNDFQDVLSASLSQSTASGQLSAFGSAGSIAAPQAISSTRQILSNQVNYVLTRALTLTVSIGHEKIAYGGTNAFNIDGATWSFGGTLTPNQTSSITISYGHQQGSDSLSFNGRYQLTARTTITGTYSDTLGTQLENLQRQLGQGSVGANGSFVNSQTGGQLFGNTNAAAIQPGVFHFKTLSATIATQLNRDTLSATLNTSNQVSAGGTAAAQASSQTNGIIMQWTHELRPDLRWTTSASYNVISGGFLGASQSIAINTSLLYTLSESLSGSARYTYFRSASSSALRNLYEDIFVLGVTKTF